MTVRRFRMRPSGFEVSKPGIDVVGAAPIDMAFDATHRSIPILTKTTPVLLNESVGAVNTIMYPKVYAKPPLSVIFVSPIYPTSTGQFYVVSGMQSGREDYYPIDWSITFGGQMGGATGCTVERLTDRITMTNWQDGSSAVTLYGFGGYAWAVIFDFG